jgi:hypothetical protein
MSEVKLNLNAVATDLLDFCGGDPRKLDKAIHGGAFIKKYKPDQVKEIVGKASIIVQMAREMADEGANDEFAEGFGPNRFSRPPAQGSPVLPIGTVNLTNGANSLIDNALDTFDKSFAYLISSPTGNKIDYKMLISSGNMNSWAAGTSGHRLIHDQRRSPIGWLWTVELVVPVSQTGFSQIKSKIGKNSIGAAVFK